MSVDLNTAVTIINGTLSMGATRSFEPLTAVVLDSGGHVVAAQRQDGSANRRFDIAYGKCHGALALGVGSRALMTRAEQQPFFIQAAALSIGGSLVPVPGGVIVRDQSGAIVGAVGVSGDTSDNDEAAAVAGIEAAGLIAQTGLHTAQ